MNKDKKAKDKSLDIIRDINMELNNFKYRNELKFVITPHEYQIIKNRLDKTMDHDLNTDTGHDYSVRSLYFDDHNLKAFFDKLNGKRDRFKYRIRVYDEDFRFIRLEAKIKADAYVAKEQLRINQQMYRTLINGDYFSHMSSEDVRKINKLNHLPPHLELFINNRVNIYKPVIIIDYEREAYTYEFGDVRITFDKNLRYGINSKDIMEKDMVFRHYFDHQEMVLEVKFNTFLPDFIRNLIQIERYNKTSFSKYTNCMIELNKYGRMIY